jgi:parvulin-like peptidyl-prolyl isomerase
MKRILLFLLFLFLNSISHGQNRESEKFQLLEKINTVKDAEIVIDSDSSLHGSVVSIDQLKDTTDFDKYLFSKKVHHTEVFKAEGGKEPFVLKILDKEELMKYRVNYIYLGTAVLTKAKIDSLRLALIDRIKKGEDFEKLAKEYSMDANASKGGDFGWHDDLEIHEDFLKEVKKHKKGDVYTVDIVEYKWYYVVKNTYEPVRVWRLWYLRMPF